MRSSLVFAALSRVPNRYLLCMITTTAIRKIHRPYSRMPDTANKVLRLVRTVEDAGSVCTDQRLAGSTPQDSTMEQVEVLWAA